MEHDDVKLLKKILKSQNQTELADMLKNSKSSLEISDSYGSLAFSHLSAFNIHSSLTTYNDLKTLSDKSKKLIHEAVLVIYPLQSNSPEIVGVNYLVDFSINEGSDVILNGLNEVSFEYVKEQTSKCDEKIRSGDFEGAVTNAKSLMETICLYIYEEISGESFIYDGHLSKLHKKVADLLKMTPDLYEDQNLKKILSGISSIVQGVSEVRNSKSDAHGKSPSDIKYRIDERHATFVVNLAKTVSEYLYLSFDKYQENKRA